MKLIQSLVLVLVVLGSSAFAGPVIPKPTQVEPLNGTFTLSAQTPVFCLAEGKTKALQLVDYLKKDIGLDLRVMEPTPSIGPPIFLDLDPTLETLGTEGYTCHITPLSIQIQAASEAGLFYGIQTLRQLIPQGKNTESYAIPAQEIRDAPRYPWRGMMLDVSRYFMDKEYVLRYLDMMAMHKMNVFHWHLIDDCGWRIEIKKYPKLTSVGAFRGKGPGTYGGYYTQEDIRQIVKRAAELHIKIVPEIELPAHTLSAIVAYPYLGCTGQQHELPNRHFISRDLYCAGKETTYRFLDDVMQEVLDLFPGKYIHVGGDEARYDRWKECPHCQAKIKAEGLKNENELQGYMTRRFEKLCQKQNRQIIGWGEVLQCGVSKTAGLMIWHQKNRATTGAQLGHPVVMALTDHAYFDTAESKLPGELPGATWIAPVTLKKAYQWDPTPVGLTADQAKNILGAHGCVWTDQFLHKPYLTDIPGLNEQRSSRYCDQLSLPRMAALAEVCWSDQKAKDFGDFERRLAKLYNRYARAGYHFRLALPKVKARANANGSTSTTAASPIDGGTVRYTTDGSWPNIYSPVLTSSVTVKKKEDFRALTVAPDGKHHSVVFEFQAPSASMKKHGQQIGQWETGKVGNGKAMAVTFDATGKITASGDYVVTFIFTGGAMRLDIDWVEILQNDKVIAHIERHGIAGGQSKDNAYKLNVGDYETGASYKVRAGIYGDTGDDSNGRVFIKKT